MLKSSIYCNAQNIIHFCAFLVKITAFGFLRVFFSIVESILCTLPLFFVFPNFSTLISEISSVSDTKVGTSTPRNPSLGGLINADYWEVHKFWRASLVTAKLHSMVGNLLVLGSTIWYIKFKVDFNGNIEGNTTRINRNTVPYPTM